MKDLRSEEYEQMLSYYKQKVLDIEYSFLLLQLEKKRALEDLKKELDKKYELIINENNDKLNQKILDMQNSYLNVKKELTNVYKKLEKNKEPLIKKKTKTVEK